METLKLENINKAIAEMHEFEARRRKEKEADAVARIMYEKFGTTDLEELRAIIINRKVGLVCDKNNSIIGVSINHRWLYTLNGQIIGKEGKRWMLEKIIWH